MFEKNGEKYFIVDGHLHFWDASPENWIKGQEQYAKGWIECFHAYMGLGPPETHWPIEKFMKSTEEAFDSDVFQDGGVGNNERKSLVHLHAQRMVAHPATEVEDHLVDEAPDDHRLQLQLHTRLQP